MSTLTPNYGLIVPDGSDTVEQVRADYATNLNTIDGIGGGGSGGHTIVNENGTDMPAEGKLQFTGNVQVTDDNGNGKTVVDILGGGGNVYGAFIDTDRVITSGTITAGVEGTYLALEDVALDFLLYASGGQNAYLKIDGKNIFSSSTSINRDFVFLKKGQTATFGSYGTNGNYTVYGLTQGTNGIFTPIIYSDIERVVGVWRDNKPLYTRTFVLPSPINVSQSSWDNMGVTVADGENVIFCWGIATDGTGSPLMGYFSSDVLMCQTPRNNNPSYSIQYLIVQYTKSSDSAGSGNWNTDGVPTVHYSTTEQVIGTWENGKPLYRRIFTTNTMNISTSAGALYSGSVTIGDYIPDVDQIFVDIGKTYVNVSGVTRGLISASQEGSVIAVYSIVSRSNCTITFTVDYTKTTD